VACRLSSIAQRSTNFWGTSPNGQRLSFAEHVFDQFPDGRIAAVWSLIDRPAIEAQLRRSNKMTTRGTPTTDSV
jgi:predicted ester cyclase